MFRFLILLIITINIQATPLTEIKRHALLLKNRMMLQNFYENYNDQPIWILDGRLKEKKVSKLLKYIHSDTTLNPKGYITQEAKRIKNTLKRKQSYAELQELEIKLTSLYYEVLQHASYGEIDWLSFDANLQNLKDANIDANWVRYPLKINLIELMYQENISLTLQQIMPKQYGYQKLLIALGRLYRVKWRGGWGVLPPSATLRVGSQGESVQALRERLILSNDYQPCGLPAFGNQFDACLAMAVQRFQRRHGLQEDGVVGKGTKSVLNISVENKIRKVLLNLDRIKWLPRQRSERYLVVNIPSYKLRYMYYQDLIKELKVIVGKRSNPSPIFSDELTYITLNPYWKVPQGIVRKEIVPAMVANPNYIRSQGLEAHETWEENSSIVSLENINWSDYLDTNNTFPYRLMQPPGPRNALGKIKFKFPNNFAVYLHDTPTKRLFSRKRRAFSHGCIRLHKPRELLATLSKDESSIDLTEADNILRGKKKKELHLDNKIPINITYLTTWVNDSNELIFGDDIYDYDRYQVRKIR